MLSVILWILILNYASAAKSPMSVDSVIARKMHMRDIPVLDNNSVEFFYNGHDKFVDLFDAIRKAKSSVHLEYFNFRNDSIAGLLFKLLGQKVKEGVEVRAMYDDFGNASNNSPIKKHMHDSICASGVRLVCFDPIRFPWVNHIIPRDHRKIVVIDGKIAYTGGMNVADYYINGIPGIGDWHDLHMRIEGPAVAELQKIFCKMWKKATGEDLSGQEKYFKTYEKAGDNRLAIIDRSRGKYSDIMRELYATMIDAAHYSIKIINPYFVPTHRVRKALKNAIDRGVKVEILVSAKGDIPLTPQAAHYVANNYMKRGAVVYLFEGGFHHTKMMIVDDVCSTVGSVNLDSRSLRCDYEVNTLILNKETTHKLIEHFNKQKESSFLMYRGWYREQSIGHRFQGWLGNFLTPFL
ncbi:MAG: cardiolipin synthase [Bacteroidaceae bacterium]|nr:cardiolipin synthase [Bacteroidaceae bacterium]